MPFIRFFLLSLLFSNQIFGVIIQPTFKYKHGKPSYKMIVAPSDPLPGNVYGAFTVNHLKKPEPSFGGSVILDYNQWSLSHASSQNAFALNEKKIDEPMMLVSLGGGHRQYNSFNEIVGLHFFVDGLVTNHCASVHFNIGLEKTDLLRHYRCFANLYIPIELPGAKPPFSERDYYFQQNNFGLDMQAKLHSNRYQPVQPSAGVFYFKDDYANRHIVGGSLGLEYKVGNIWSIRFKAFYDTARSAHGTIALQANLCVPHHISHLLFPIERHLSPLFLPTAFPKR